MWDTVNVCANVKAGGDQLTETDEARSSVVAAGSASNPVLLPSSFSFFHPLVVCRWKRAKRRVLLQSPSGPVGSQRWWRRLDQSVCEHTHCPLCCRTRMHQCANIYNPVFLFFFLFIFSIALLFFLFQIKKYEINSLFVLNSNFQRNSNSAIWIRENWSDQLIS